MKTPQSELDKRYNERQKELRILKKTVGCLLSVLDFAWSDIGKAIPEYREARAVLAKEPEEGK